MGFRSQLLHARFAIVVAAACGGQGTELKDQTNPAADGGTIQGNAAPTPYTDPFAGAPAYGKPKPGDTSHNAGRACSDKGCHGAGGEGPAFLMGGTVYSDYAGTKPAVGIEVRIVDTNGNGASAFSDSGGNFYIKSGGTVKLPAVVGVRDANLARPMITQLTGAMGSCGQASCHEHPANPNAQDPIHFP